MGVIALIGIAEVVEGYRKFNSIKRNFDKKTLDWLIERGEK